MKKRSLKNRYMRIMILCFNILSISQVVNAQLDGIFSQYTYTKNFYNPASIGELDMARAFLAHRIQWVGITNAPQTTFASFNMPFEIQKKQMAAGLTITNDKFGIFRHQNINIQYAYKWQFEYGKLSIGTTIGAMNITINGDSAHIAESDYHTPAASDPAIPNGEETGTSLDLSIGAYFQASNWYSGFCINHINAPTIEVGMKNDFTVQPIMNFMGGYNFPLSNKNWHIKPSLLIVSDFVSWQTFLTSQVEYKKKFWSGLSYSYQNALSIMLGMNVTNEIKIGYTYDLPISEIIRSTTGSHEVFLAYDFNLAMKKKNKKHKSVRIL